QSRCASSKRSRKRSWTSSFFFSSRRRHTRWPRDWSSDVCSSDLPACPWAGDWNDPKSRESAGKVRLAMNLAVNKKAIINALWKRSEERRVGKEGRAGVSQLAARKEADWAVCCRQS